MPLSDERIEFIKKRYGENSRTYTLLLEAEKSEPSDVVNLRPGEDEE
tara:strand:+ start:1512 stop:1652 length:141 start_codon:yes stop_codon:yes gene_type:complete